MAPEAMTGFEPATMGRPYTSRLLTSFSAPSTPLWFSCELPIFSHLNYIAKRAGWDLNPRLEVKSLVFNLTELPAHQPPAHYRREGLQTRACQLYTLPSASQKEEVGIEPTTRINERRFSRPLDVPMSTPPWLRHIQFSKTAPLVYSTLRKK